MRWHWAKKDSGANGGNRQRNALRKTRLFIEQCEARRLLAATPAMTTYHYDNSSTGQNLLETQLTPANVNATTFGKLLTTPVDGQVYAQPLYLSSLNLTGGSSLGLHNVAFVATEHDSLYAIDTNNGAVLWKTSFINPGTGITTVPSSDVASADLTPEIGITATPVIDAASGTIYVVAKTKKNSGGLHYMQTLYAVNVANGAVKGSTVIADTIATNPNTPNTSKYTYVSGPAVPGSGDGSVGGVVHFNALRQLGRVGLTLANGSIYMAFASHGDNNPYHGWVLSYSAQSLVLNGVFNTTPNGNEGGIWQSGGVVAVDDQGSLYVETGNGTFDTSFSAGMPSRGDYGDSFIKIVVDPTTSSTHQNVNGWGLKAVDYFTPFNQASFEQHDTDLGSGGPMLLPDSVGSAAHQHLLIGGGKEGRIYLIDRDNMGHFNASGDQVVQELLGPVKPIFDTPAFFYDGTTSRVYIGTIADSLKAFTIVSGALSSTFSANSPDTFGFPGTTPTISASGATGGIVWDIDRGTNQLRAYNASNVGNELYTSAQAGGRDALGMAVKFTSPTVIDGRVLVGTSNSLVIYGSLAPPQLGPGPYSLWNNSTVPGWIDNPDNQAVELGVKFRSDNDGYISGLRFYKSTNNTGTHVADLWSTDGTLLATATFTSETVSGWQTVNFTQPVAIKAGTNYIASYHTNAGHYSDDIGYFASGVNSGPLHAPADGVNGPNGVYAYGPAGSFPTSTYHASNYWVDVLLTSLVNSLTPSNGATGVAVDAAVSVRFNAPMNAATLNSSTLILQDSQGNAVATTIGYDSNTQTATLTPQSPLAKGKTYIVTVKGGAGGVADQNGNTLANSIVSSFATVLPPIPLAPGPFSIWSTSTSPGVTDNPDTQAVELGVKFRSTGDGFITGIRFYKSAKNTGTHVGNLWAADGTLLATATFTSESASGWQTVTFAQPVAIKSGTTYIASYHTNAGHYADDIGFFSKGGVTSGPLTALANGADGPNGVYQYGASSPFPANTYNSSNYWVDVVLTSLVGSVTPSSKATGVPTNSTVQIKFNTAMDVTRLNTSTLLLRNAANQNAALSIAYDANTRVATLTPSAPLANGTTFTVVVKGGASGILDTLGDAMATDYTSTFTTAVAAGQTGPVSIFGNSAVPAWIDNPDAQPVELGMKFRSDLDGSISGLRFYKSAANTGTHVANLWANDGTLLGSATFTSETAAGWQTVTFAQPIAIKANTTYIASYHTNAGHYSDDIGYFTAGSITSGPLHALGDGLDGPNGVYHYGAASALPTDTYHASNYWVDVIFTTP